MATLIYILIAMISFPLFCIFDGYRNREDFSKDFINFIGNFVVACIWPISVTILLCMNYKRFYMFGRKMRENDNKCE